MADTAPIWVMYAAQYDVGRQLSRIIPESINILRTSDHEITLDELDAERDRTGLGADLRVIEIEAPPGLNDTDLATHAIQHIAAEPEFDFWNDVIGDDIVVGGVVYDSDLYAPDGEGGVRELTEDERAARRRTLLSDSSPPNEPRTDAEPASLAELRNRAAHLRAVPLNDRPESGATSSIALDDRDHVANRYPGSEQPPWADVEATEPGPSDYPEVEL